MRATLCLGMLLVSTTAQAGAWTRSLGSYYAKAGVDLYAASTYQSADFVSTEGQSFLGYQLGVYGEFGVLNAHPVMVAVQAPWASSTLFFEEKTGTFRPRATTRRLGDLKFTAQTSVLPDGGPLSASVEVKIPLYSNDSVGSRYAGYEELFPLAGEGQVDVTGWLLGGASFGGPWWGEAAVGYQHRTSAFIGWMNRGDLDFLDRVRFGAGLGFSEGPVVAILRVDGQKALGVDAITSESLSVGPVLLIDVAEGIAIEGRFAADLWANNATQGVGAGTGISIRK
jgi:hypothetical protein